jgi:hypothetical protein
MRKKRLTTYTRDSTKFRFNNSEVGGFLELGYAVSLLLR